MSKTHRLYCRIEPEEKARLDRVAEVTGETASTLLRNFINKPLSDMGFMVTQKAARNNHCTQARLRVACM